MVNTAELRQIFPLRENTLRHVVEGDGRYPRATTPSDHGATLVLKTYLELQVHRWVSLQFCQFSSKRYLETLHDFSVRVILTVLYKDVQIIIFSKR